MHVGEFLRAAIRRVASMPSSPGIRMSIKITSGRVRSGHADRLQSVGGLADHLDAVFRPQQRGEAGPDQFLVVGEDDPDHCSLPLVGSTAVTRNPPPGRGPAVSRPPSALRPVGHPGDPAAGACGPRGLGTGHILVVHPDLHLAVTVAHPDGGPRRPECLALLVSASWMMR